MSQAAVSSAERTFACFFDPSKSTSGQRFFAALVRQLQPLCVADLSRADAVLFNVSAPLGELVKARLRGQEIILRLDGLYHDRLSPEFVASFRWPMRTLLRAGLRLGIGLTALSQLANIVNRNYGALARALLADRIVYQSEFCRASWRLYLPRKRSVVVLNGAGWRGEQAISSSHNGAARIELVTTYDDWKPAKRIDDLVEFVRWANETRGVAVRLTIIGFTGRFPATFSQGAKELIRSAPFVRTQPRYVEIDQSVQSAFRASDAYVTFTYRDPCPNVVVEAMSYGLPVVATDSGGLGEIVRDAGALIRIAEDSGAHFHASRYERAFPPVDFPAVLAAIQAVVANCSDYRRRVQRRFAEDLDLRVVADRYAELLMHRAESSRAAASGDGT